MTMQKVGTKLRAQAGFSEAMADARITGVGAMKRFLALYPELFVVEGRAPRVKVKLAEPPAEAATPAAAAPPATALTPAGGHIIRIARLPGKRRG